MFISTEEIDRLIGEDVPYIDLTSWSLGIRGQSCKISYTIRENAVICGTEEVRRIFSRLNIETTHFTASGEDIDAGQVVIAGNGRADDVHMAWKVGLNILEHCSGISTKTRRMVLKVKEISPSTAVLTTRKGFPGTKRLAVKAIMAGGASPHRLGLSETVLVFKQHIDLIGGFDALLSKIPELKTDCCEKKIIVEASEREEARRLCEAGADGIQFDKVRPEVLSEIVYELRRDYPKTVFLAAGGINEANIAEYARAELNGIVTTNLYTASPVDIGANITLL